MRRCRACSVSLALRPLLLYRVSRPDGAFLRGGRGWKIQLPPVLRLGAFVCTLFPPVLFPPWLGLAFVALLFIACLGAMVAWLLRSGTPRLQSPRHSKTRWRKCDGKRALAGKVRDSVSGELSVQQNQCGSVQSEYSESVDGCRGCRCRPAQSGQ